MEFSLLRSRSRVFSVLVDLGAGEEGGIETAGGGTVLPLPAVDSCLADRSVIGLPEMLACDQDCISSSVFISSITSSIC